MTMTNTILIRGWILSVLVTAPVGAGSTGSYKLDLDGPEQLIDRRLDGPVPNRVEIYVTGPRIYIDKSETPASLSKKAPACIVTNKTDISEMVSILSEDDNKDRLTNVMRRRGYTYHVLLFHDDDKKVMHFRVFKTTDVETSWMHVYPRAYPEFVYFNHRVGSWLHSHVKPLTNEGSMR